MTLVGRLCMATLEGNELIFNDINHPIVKAFKDLCGVRSNDETESQFVTRLNAIFNEGCFGYHSNKTNSLVIGNVVADFSSEKTGLRSFSLQFRPLKSTDLGRNSDGLIAHFATSYLFLIKHSNILFKKNYCASWKMKF